MRVSLVPLKVTGTRATILTRIEAHVRAASDADLVVFPEAALGSFPCGRDPGRDRPLAVSVPGPETETVGQWARKHDTWIGLGLMEGDERALYDSFLLFAPSGMVALHYRRIHPGWFFPDADRRVYRVGTTLPVVLTKAGRTGTLICGDLFEDALLERVRSLELDLLLVPMARSIPPGAGPLEDELDAYAAQVARLRVRTLVTNRVDAPFVGGAFAFAADGQPLTSIPTHVERRLCVFVPNAG